MSVCCECCVLLGRGLCVGLITCPWGVLLPTVMRRRVWSRNLVNDAALAHWGPFFPPPPQNNIWRSLPLSSSSLRSFLNRPVFFSLLASTKLLSTPHTTSAMYVRPCR
jgi:hypothetical protein